MSRQHRHRHRLDTHTGAKLCRHRLLGTDSCVKLGRHRLLGIDSGAKLRRDNSKQTNKKGRRWEKQSTECPDATSLRHMFVFKNLKK